MSHTRLFDRKPSPEVQEFEKHEITKYYQQLYSDFFSKIVNPRYKELIKVLQALKTNNIFEFIRIADQLVKPNEKLIIEIPDYRKKNHPEMYIFKCNWSNSIFGHGRNFREKLLPIHHKVLQVKKLEKKYKALCDARDALNHLHEKKDEPVSVHWQKLHNAKVKCETDVVYLANDEIALAFYEAIVEMLAELFFKQTIHGLDLNSIPANFPQILSVLIHGDPELILQSVQEGVFSNSFTVIKEQHQHVFKKTPKNHYENVIEFMQFKISTKNVSAHDFFEIIPLFIKKCIEYQERLVTENFPTLDPLTEVEKAVLVEKDLHTDHSIKKNLSELSEITIYTQVKMMNKGFDHIKKEHYYILPSFAEFCEAKLSRPHANSARNSSVNKKI